MSSEQCYAALSIQFGTSIIQIFRVHYVDDMIERPSKLQEEITTTRKS